MFAACFSFLSFFHPHICSIYICLSIVFIHKRCWKSLLSFRDPTMIETRHEVRKGTLTLRFPHVRCGTPCLLRNLVSVLELLRFFLCPDSIVGILVRSHHLPFDMCRNSLDGNFMSSHVRATSNDRRWKPRTLCYILADGHRRKGSNMTAASTIFDDWSKFGLRIRWSISPNFSAPPSKVSE